MLKSTLLLTVSVMLLSIRALDSAPMKVAALKRSSVKPSSAPDFSDLPFNVSAHEIPLNYKGHNVKQIYETLAERITPKGEYETTGAFKTRIGNLSHATLFGSLKFDSDLAFVTKADSTYNADRNVMELQFFIAAPTTGIASMRFNDEGVFTTNSAILSKTLYLGENGFGAKRQVTKTISKNYPLFLSGWATLPLKKSESGFASSSPEGRLDIPMSVGAAKAVKGNVKIALIYNLQYPYVAKNVSYKKATINFPYESETRSYYIRGVLKSLWVYNGKTGQVLVQLNNSVKN